MRPLISVGFQNILCIMLCLGVFEFNGAHASSDPYRNPSSSARLIASTRIAVVGSDGAVARLQKLGFTAERIQEHDADPSKLKKYGAIYLATSWAENQQQLAHYDALAESYHQFVRRGGALIAGQANPYRLPGARCRPKLLPYPITYHSPYEDTDKTRVAVAPNHFITKGDKGEELPFPFDALLDIDERYEQLVKQKATDVCSLAVCQYGHGRVVVHTASEIPGAKVDMSDQVLKRMILWAMRREHEYGAAK